MADYEINQMRKKKVAEGSGTIPMDKPHGFNFTAWKPFDIAPSEFSGIDDRGKALALSSAPFNSQASIAARVRASAYKDVLKNMTDGQSERLAGPFGAFALHGDNRRPGVFLAGGVGIPPFMSIIKHPCDECRPYQLLLFYSNRRPEHAEFLIDLREIEQALSNFRLVSIMTRLSTSVSSSNSQSARLGLERVKLVLADATSPVYYSAGPRRMVLALRTMLKDAGVDDRDIRIEEFMR